MNRNEYIKRVLPVVSELGEEKTDMVMDKIAQYLVAAGEENETAALNALGVPEIFARKFLHTDGEYEIPPFIKGGDDRSHKSHNRAESVVSSRPMPKPFENKEPPQRQRSAASQSGNRKFTFIIILLIITSPVWFCFLALFAIIAMVFAVAVTALLLTMSVGGAALVVLGAIRMFTVFPVGLMMVGAGLLLLGIAGVAFIPLLMQSVRLLCDNVKDIYIFARSIIKRAYSIRMEADSV